nr:uncharacterized protein LOC109617396 [Crassostrea gigas]
MNFETACFLLTFFATICSQSLYDTNHQQLSVLNRGNSGDVFQSLLDETEDILKETMSKMQRCVHLEELRSVAYEGLLKMYSKGQFPNDTTIDEICTRYPDLITKSPEDCHRYYNCSGEDPALSSWIPMYNFWPSKYKHECHYPFMFSDETLQCENYTSTNCGTRYLPVWECRDFRLQCKLSHCIPCEVRYPKCEDKEDGLWPQPERGFSPQYMICKDNRIIETGYCPVDNVWSVQSFPYMGQCVHLFAIPNDYNSNGYLPSCNGKADGNYQYRERCDAYYQCDNGIASAVKCPNGTVFDSANKICAVGGKCSK